MKNNKSLMVKNESLFKKFLNKLFKKEKFCEDVEKQEFKKNSDMNETTRGNKEFLNSIKIEENSEIIYLKIKLQNGEVKAIDLTDEQIDQLQKIYDKEIEEKKNKVIKLKNIA